MSHTPDEAQLTAYLLGELTPDASAQVEAQLAVSAALREELAGLRQTAASLEAALASQPAPAVPALDRQKLHSLLQSAVVTGHEPTVSAPALLANAPAQSARGSTSRGWLVAAAVLVVGGLVALSQMEQIGYKKPPIAMLTKPGPMIVGPGPGVLVTARAASREQEIAQLVEKFNDFKQQGRYEKAYDVAQQALQLDPNSSVAAQMELMARFAMPTDAIAEFRRNKEPSFHKTGHPFDELSVDAPEVVARSNWGEIRSRLLNKNLVQDAAPTGLATDSSSRAKLYATDASNLSLIAQQPAHWSTRVRNGRSPAEQLQGYGREDTHQNFNFGAIEEGQGVTQYFFEHNTDVNGVGLGGGVGRVLSDDSPAGLGFMPAEPYGMTRQEQLVTNSDSDEPLLRRLSLQLTTEDIGVLPQLLHAESEKLAELDNSERGESKVRLRQLNRAGSGDLDGEMAGEQPDSPVKHQLTVVDYEAGLTQLGNAIRDWKTVSRQSLPPQTGPEVPEGLTQEVSPGQEPKTSTSAADSPVDELEELVTEQTTELKKLRESNPELSEKPLAEVDLKAAQNAELALVRVSRELQRQQQVWYYREGYVRQLEATIAAAEQYAHVPENDFVTPEAQPLSTFGIDVDTASYSNVRRFVESSQLPPPDAVRIEELVNSFQYDGPKVEGDHPIAVSGEVSVCPWQPQHRLLRVSLKGKSIDLQQRPPARLVFLVDTSGSMSDENKLPLVKQSLRILVDQMREQDRLSIVTYSDNAGLLLDSTGGDKREAILAAIDGLVSDGSTNGEAGLKLAYEVAVKQFGEGATNRVMLCTDGDFNVGESADSELVKLIEKQRQTGVFLNIFGFGSGNLKDAKLEAIADKGNGQYIYIDGIKEARKTLLNELTGTLYTIAKDVKLQLEFNPNLVGSYRLVGYENRAMAAKDFANDKVDSGDMGAGHSVVALYEIVPSGAPQPVAPKPETEPLKYQRAGSVSARSENAAAPAGTLTPSPSPGGKGAAEGATEIFQPAPAAEAEKPADPLATELCTIRVRYKQPTANESTKIETIVHDPRLLFGTNAPTSKDHVWATAVAQFGLLLRHSSFAGSGNFGQVLELAQSALGDDPIGQRREFVTLVRQTQHLSLERERQIAELSRRAEQHRRVVDEIKTVEKAPDVMTKASCQGKYQTLLRRIEVTEDQSTYGEFKDFGRWEGVEYRNHKSLPHGYWVYVAPHWYIWGESTERAAVEKKQ